MAVGAYVEGRFETGASPGTEAAVSSTFATKIVFFPAISFEHDDNISMLRRDDEMRNVNEPLAFVPEDFAPTWSMELRGYPDSLAFLLKAHLGAPTTTAGDGVITDLAAVAIPAGATRHTWTAPYATGSIPQTVAFRIAYADGVYYDVRGASVEKLEISTPDQGGIRVQVSGKANYILRQADPSLTPAYESLGIEPFHKAFAALSWLAGTANTETVSVSIEKPVDHSRTFGGASKWPNLVEHGEGVPRVMGSIAKRVIDPDDWDALIAGTRFTSLISWVHSDFAVGAYPYKVFVQGPSTSTAYSNGGPDAVQNRKRTPASFDFELTRDAAASSVIQVVNATASYA